MWDQYGDIFNSDLIGQKFLNDWHVGTVNLSACHMYIRKDRARTIVFKIQYQNEISEQLNLGGV